NTDGEISRRQDGRDVSRTTASDLDLVVEHQLVQKHLSDQLRNDAVSAPGRMDAVPEEMLVRLRASERRRARKTELRHVGFDARRRRIPQAELRGIPLDGGESVKSVELHDRYSWQRGGQP